MRKGTQRSLGLGAAVAVTMLLAGGLSAQEPIPDPAPQCEVTLDVERVPIQEEPVAVQATYTAEIGEQVSAEFAPESQVSVVSVERAEEDAPMTQRLTLITAEAVEGEWQLILRGDGGECTGTIAVGGPDGDL